MLLAALYTFALLLLVSAWLCGTLAMASAMRASMPNVEPMPSWMLTAMRPVSAVFMGVTAAVLASRAGFTGVFLAGFAAVGLAMGLASDLIWRAVRKRMQARARGSRQDG